MLTELLWVFVDVCYGTSFGDEVTSCLCFQPNQITTPHSKPHGSLFSTRKYRPISSRFEPCQPPEMVQNKHLLHFHVALGHCCFFLPQSGANGTAGWKSHQCVCECVYESVCEWVCESVSVLGSSGLIGDYCVREGSVISECKSLGDVVTDRNAFRPQIVTRLSDLQP